MKLIVLTAVISFSFLCSAALGQRVASQKDNVGIIDTDAFYDPESGIKVLLSAIAPLESEFKGRNDELIVRVKKYNELSTNLKHITEQHKPGRELPADFGQKVDELQEEEILIKSLQEERNHFYYERREELSKPFIPEISKALEQFRIEKGLEVIFDNDKLQALDISCCDVTNQFIDFFNNVFSKQNVK